VFLHVSGIALSHASLTRNQSIIYIIIACDGKSPLFATLEYCSTVNNTINAHQIVAIYQCPFLLELDPGTTTLLSVTSSRVADLRLRLH